MLLVSVGDGLFYIKTAKKAREVLTDRMAGRIADNVRPHLKNGRAAWLKKVDRSLTVCPSCQCVGHVSTQIEDAPKSIKILCQADPN